MEIFSKYKSISLDDYINEIKKSLENRNYLSALSVALIIPDICKKMSDEDLSYADWYNKYIYEKYYGIPYDEEEIKQDRTYKTSQIRLNGDVCYALRNAILHSGKLQLIYRKKENRQKAKIDKIELCINSKSPINNQYGEAVSIITFADKKEISLRVNIITLINCIIDGTLEYKKQLDNKDLFIMIDWDKEEI